MQLGQGDCDAVISIVHGMVSGTVLDGALPLEARRSEALLGLSVSDKDKTLILNNPDALPSLVFDLFLDPEHPKGLRAQEILGYRGFRRGA